MSNISLKKIDVNSFIIFVRGCAYIAKRFLKVDALK